MDDLVWNPNLLKFARRNTGAVYANAERHAGESTPAGYGSGMRSREIPLSVR